ncbi:MAG: undecaprenyl-diphosphate phosphatase [Brevinematales bacterium]|nr:undecaprenyl-diphosphate phosphatase [Brevinematales bacterium]
MDFLKAIVLGIVEGITEFLPISSTGHLIILNEFISFGNSFEKTFDIVIQLGAILSVVFYFWDKIYPFKKDRLKQTENLVLWLKIGVAVIPAIIIGALAGSKIQEYLFNPLVVAIMLIIGGVVIYFLDKNDKKFKYNSLGEISFKVAFFIGLFQCLSFVPGTSRAAATIIGAMILGLSREAAVEFSFFLAIPTMIMASSYSLLKIGFNISPKEWGILITGFIVSFFVAYGVIAFFINYVRSKNFIPFAIYRIFLGIIVLLFFLLKGNLI